MGWTINGVFRFRRSGGRLSRSTYADFVAEGNDAGGLLIGLAAGRVADAGAELKDMPFADARAEALRGIVGRSRIA